MTKEMRSNTHNSRAMSGLQYYNKPWIVPRKNAKIRVNEPPTIRKAFNKNVRNEHRTDMY